MNIIVEQSSPLSLYMQIKEQIKTYLVKNKISSGYCLPDVKTISNNANVSLGTAEKALKELIKEGICFRRPKKGTFVGNLQKLMKQRKICGICHSKGIKSFKKDLIQEVIYKGISEQAKEKGIDFFFLSGNREEGISFYLAQNKLNLTGVIMLHWEELEEGKRLAEKFPEVKFIYLNYFLPGFEETPPNVYGVFNDDYTGAYQMTEYLVAKGHRKIAVFSVKVDSDENYHRRIEGYKDALRDNGIKPKKSLVCKIAREEGVTLKDIGKNLTRKSICSNSIPTAIFCVNDIIAAGAKDYLRTIGKEKEIEVTGYDNVIPSISREYGFSTVGIDFKKMGAKAIILLDNERKHYPKVIRIIPKLIIRN